MRAIRKRILLILRVEIATCQLSAPRGQEGSPCCVPSLPFAEHDLVAGTHPIMRRPVRVSERLAAEA